MEIEESTACLSIQRALLDKVTPNLRMVAYAVRKNIIYVNFFYNKKPTELEEELAQDAGAEIIADFPSSFTINVNVSTVTYPEKILPIDRVLYSRYEENL